MRYVELANCTLDQAFKTSVIQVCVTLCFGKDMDAEKERQVKQWQKSH